MQVTIKGKSYKTSRKEIAEVLENLHELYDAIVENTGQKQMDCQEKARGYLKKFGLIDPSETGEQSNPWVEKGGENANNKA